MLKCTFVNAQLQYGLPVGEVDGMNIFFPVEVGCHKETGIGLLIRVSGKAPNIGMEQPVADVLHRQFDLCSAAVDLRTELTTEGPSIFCGVGVADGRKFCLDKQFVRDRFPILSKDSLGLLLILNNFAEDCCRVQNGTIQGVIDLIVVCFVY